ncbi:MAG: YIP1 family protein [Acidobacteriota bacterium]
MNSELSYASQPQSEAPTDAPKPQNHFSRLSGVFFSPGETFQEIGRAPRLLIPMLLLAILAGVTNFLIVHRIGYENVVRKEMEPVVKAGWIPAEQAEQQIQLQITGTRAIIGKIQRPVTAGVGFLVVLLIVAGVFKLFTMLTGTTNRFKPLLSVICYAYLAIAIIHLSIIVITIYLKNPDEIDMYNPVSSNLGAVLTVAGAGLPKFITALAGWVDVFGIWRIVLLGIGCAAVTPKMKSGTAAIPHIVLYCIAALLFSAMAAMFS